MNIQPSQAELAAPWDGRKLNRWQEGSISGPNVNRWPAREPRF